MRRHKFNAKPQIVDGFRFASTAEANRYLELMILGKCGALDNLELQPRFQLVVNGQKVGEYRADFAYRDRPGNALVVEDVKGMVTPVYRLKKKLVEAQYGITIREIHR